MIYIQDEYYILKQNLIMLKHNIRLNKIEYTIALLLLIFYTLYIMGYLLAALSEGIIRLEFQSFDLFIISELRITESDYISNFTVAYLLYRNVKTNTVSF